MSCSRRSRVLSAAPPSRSIGRQRLGATGEGLRRLALTYSRAYVHSLTRCMRHVRHSLSLSAVGLPVPQHRASAEVAGGAWRRGAAQDPPGGMRALSTTSSALDDLLQDTLASPVRPPASRATAAARPVSPDAGGAAGSVKCKAVLLGPAAADMGVCVTMLEKRACNRIRCTSCDFEVVRFAGASWRSEADYLFFRLNMPNAARLNTMLNRADADCSAYSCQCRWLTVGALSPLSAFDKPGAPAPRWVCGGHQ